MPPNSFKSDESFLQKLAIGAAGTKATMVRLRELGFDPIELERGSSGFKLWKRIKIKRVRVPDILCLRSGLRFESRGKTKLEISMSHSLADPNRAWNTGLADHDYVVIVVCKQASESIVDWQPVSPIHFVRVEDMRLAFAADKVKITRPKGVEEGSEIRVIWSSVGANAKSKVEDVTPKSILLHAIDDHIPQRCMLTRKSGELAPLCSPGQVVEKNQIVAAVTPLTLTLTSPIDVGEDFFRNKLSSRILSERYAAAKALRFRGYQDADNELRSIMLDDQEDIYVRLEAAAALAAYDDEQGWLFLRSSLESDYDQVQLETVIVLSEIKKAASQMMLIAVLADTQKHEEIRAGAAWALGEFQSDETVLTLASVFDETSQEIKAEAARALLRIAPAQASQLLDLIKSSNAVLRDGLAWVLARQGQFDPQELLEDKSDDNLRRWVGYILGYGKDHFLASALEEIATSDPEVYFSASVLWQLLASWIRDLKEYG